MEKKLGVTLKTLVTDTSVRSAQPFVLSQVVAGLRQSKSLILWAAHGRKKIGDYSLQRNWLRKYKLHCGSQSNE
jgi:hypothetical protein